MPLDQLAPGGLAGQESRLETLYAQYRGGATIVIQFLHERWEPLKRLCHALAAEFSAGIHVNVYLTPRDEKGLLTHYDTHDVFVLQTEGSKHWRLYEEPFPLPLRGQASRRRTPGKLSLEFDLEAGDFLYVPRGFFHDAVSTDTTSVHLTVGVHPVTWAAVLLGAVESVIEREPRFRESLPIGFASKEEYRAGAELKLVELIDILRNEIDPSSVLENAIDVASRAGPSFLAAHLLDLEATHQLDLDTPVRRRPEIRWRLRVEGDQACLSFHGKDVRMPAFVKPDLQFITDVTDSFSGADFPGPLDAPGRVTLLRRLLQEGFLTVAT